jgi:hypothetical protein
MDGLFNCDLDDCDMVRRWQCRVAETMRAGATALKGSAGATKLILKERQRDPGWIHGAMYDNWGDGFQVHGES